MQAGEPDRERADAVSGTCIRGSRSTSRAALSRQAAPRSLFQAIWHLATS